MNCFRSLCFCLLASLLWSGPASASQPDSGGLRERIVSAAQMLDRSPYIDFNAMIAGDAGDRYSAMRARPTAFHALYSDPRFSFSMYFPEGFLEQPDDYQLLVLIHGSGRNAGAYRDTFKRYADENKYVLLAPLFPVGVYGNGYADGYKFLSEREVRYDQVLQQMVQEVYAACRCDLGAFHLYGFSGGGQFAHRFLYLHPEQLRSVSIGAPGLVTKINDQNPWFFGTGGVDRTFEADVNLDAIRRVPVQIIVGSLDTEPFSVPDAYRGVVEELLGEHGDTRLENMRILQKHYEQMGLDSRLVVVEGAAHEGLKMAPYVMEFFMSVRADSH